MGFTVREFFEFYNAYDKICTYKLNLYNFHAAHLK